MLCEGSSPERCPLIFFAQGNLFLTALMLIFSLMAGCPTAVAYEYQT